MCSVWFVDALCMDVSLVILESVKVIFRGSGRADTKIVASLCPFERCMNSRRHVDTKNLHGNE